MAQVRLPIFIAEIATMGANPIAGIQETSTKIQIQRN